MRNEILQAAKRGEREVEKLTEWASALAQDPRVHQQQRVRVKAAGRLEMLPASTVAAIRAAEEATASYDDGLALTIAVAYGGHDEITDAVRALLREAAVEGHRVWRIGGGSGPLLRAVSTRGRKCGGSQ